MDLFPPVLESEYHLNIGHQESRLQCKGGEHNVAMLLKYPQWQSVHRSLKRELAGPWRARPAFKRQKPAGVGPFRSRTYSVTPCGGIGPIPPHYRRGRGGLVQGCDRGGRKLARVTSCWPMTYRLLSIDTKVYMTTRKEEGMDTVRTEPQSSDDDCGLRKEGKWKRFS